MIGQPETEIFTSNMYENCQQSLYYPTKANNVKNAELLKHVKIMDAAPTFFGLQRNHNQGATASA